MERDGIYASFGIEHGGFVILAGEWALAYPIYGTKRGLFERWRERELSISLADMQDINLRDELGISVARRK